MTSTPPATPTVMLAAGARMPLVGFGTFPMRGDEARVAVSQALEVGYRSIDTAARYRNQDEIGDALRSSPVPREEVFITTKLPPDSVRHEQEVLEDSLARLGTDHLDLWLIHWPPGGSAGVSAWKEMIRMRERGLVRAIGVSNYRIRLFDELHEATGVYPEMAQLQWSPVHFSARYLEAARRRGIVLSAYSPFNSARLDDPVLRRIGERHGVATTQVIVRWNVQHGVSAVPKTATRDRMERNLDVLGFELDDGEMRDIDDLSELE